MQNFKAFLNEALSPSGLPKATSLIISYLAKNGCAGIFAFPGAEEYKNSSGKGFGARFFIPHGNRSLRLNWSSPNAIGLVGVESADVWLDDPRPYHISFDSSVSLAQTLPLIADYLNGETTLGTIRLEPTDLPMHEAAELRKTAILLEARAADPSESFDGMIRLMKGNNFSKGSVWAQYKGMGMKIFFELASRYPRLLGKQGISYVWSGNSADADNIAKDKNKILDAIGASGATVSRGSGNEQYPDKDTDALENDLNRLTYEQQITDLENLIKLTVGGSANALFVAGRGGIGKTHTVEKVLAQLGKTDGNGYFKNTGTASAAGIYSLLFQHRDGIVLFDDSDDALKDQEARNIFKAATDTKKVRKLVWNKMGKNIVDPDSMTDDDIDAGLLPRYFEFTGKIIFISNLNMDKLDPDGAIRTRAYMIDISPTDKEVFDFMEKIVDDIPLQDGLKLSHADRVAVVGLLRTGTSKQTANLRKLSRGLNMRAAATGISDSELSRMIAAYA